MFQQQLSRRVYSLRTAKGIDLVKDSLMVLLFSLKKVNGSKPSLLKVHL